MKTTPRLKVVKDPVPSERPRLRRDGVLAFLVVTILFSGALGGAPSPLSAAAVTGMTEPVVPSQETIYFPSQYVNQGREIPDPAPTF
jgi:hypothetical protein